MPSSTHNYGSGTPVRIGFSVRSLRRGREILEHLVEERLVAGGTVIQAEALNWVGGKINEQLRKEVTAYTTIEKLPLIRERLEMLYGEDAPLLSQFVMTQEKKEVVGWIGRNTRK